MPLPTTYTLLNYEELRRLLRETSADFAPTIDDREVWERLAGTPVGKAIRDAALTEAGEMALVPNVPAPTLSEFLAFARTGDRRTWEDKAAAFGDRVDAFALTACFTGEAYWVERAADALWAICELTTWVTPAHEFQPIPDPENLTVELWSAMVAQQVAETVATLRPALDRIDPRIVRHIHREIDRRVFAPFLARGDWWWLFPQHNHGLNNWTAVCSGAILCAAFAALNHDPERQAQVVHKAAWSLSFFKDTFGAKGSLDEGVGYWAYGLSYFVPAAERLSVRTGGVMDPLADPLWRDIAAFPLHTRLYGDTFVNFSDCAPHVNPSPGWLHWLGTHLEIPGLCDWAATVANLSSAETAPHHYFSDTLRTLLWLPQSSSPLHPQHLTLHTYLPDVEWMIARSDASEDALALAVKGGHNAENHNHNDGGSFIVHVWQEPFIAELGAPTYTRQFFSGERYENIAARSLGHSVPFVNGQEQRAGREYAAENVRCESDGITDTLTQDLAGFYGPEAKLSSLVRRVSLCRGTGECPGVCITLTDFASFTEEGGTLALPLITLDRTLKVIEPGRAEIIGDRGKLILTWDTAQATCRAEPIPTEDPKFLTPDGKTRIHRFCFDIAVTGNEGRLHLRMQPA